MSKKFEIPWVMSNERIEDQDYHDCYNAARKHQKQLRKAEWDLEKARDHCEILRGYLGETDIAQCMTAGTVVQLIEDLVSRARARLDRHDTEHKNLFIAYFDQHAAGGAS